MGRFRGFRFLGFLAVVSLLLTTGTAAQTKTLVGQWQGSVILGQAVRLVFVISGATSGTSQRIGIQLR